MIYINLGLKYNHNDKLYTKKSRLPIISTGTGEFNFFSFKYNAPFPYFNNKNFDNNLLKTIAQKLNVDLIIISFTEIIHANQANLHSLNFMRLHKLRSCLYFFNTDGWFETGIQEFSKTYHSKKINLYPLMLDDFYELNKKLIDVAPNYLIHNTKN